MLKETSLPIKKKSLFCTQWTTTVERDDLHSKFSRSVMELQEKSSLKYAVLEKKIHAIRKELVSRYYI